MSDNWEWEGLENRSEHYPLKTRSWCSLDREYCYENAYCRCCGIPILCAAISDYEDVLRKIAVPRRPDGTYNYGREACELMAKEVIAKNFDKVQMAI